MHHSPLIAAEATCACTALRKASRAVTRMYDEAMHETGMTIVQFSILRNLARAGALPLMQLADLLVMERTTLYRALGPLERDGWVSVSDAAGRAKIASLTDHGRRTLAAATPSWEAAQQRLLHGVGGVEWKSLEGALARLVALAQRPA